jgi:hypothetical protein
VPSIRNLLCAALVAGVLFSAPSAEARFGKRSNSSESKEKDKTHDASAVGDDDDDDDDDRGSSGGSSAASSFLVDLLFAIFVDSRPSTTYVAAAETVASASEVSTSAAPSSPSTLRLGVDGGGMSGGAGLGAFLAIEGRRVGVEGRVLALMLPTDDGTPGTDGITLTNAHLTVAVLAHERARFRLEAGVSSAHAPDITFVGPSFALSMEACITGPLDVELRAQATPFPYRQLDTSAGLALHLSSLVVRGGYRGLYLDDAGQVDGERHQDVLYGPFLGLGFAF